MENSVNKKCKNCGADLSVINEEISIIFCPFCGQELQGDTILMPALRYEVERMVYEWLAKTLDIEIGLVSETVQNQVATVFLLIWPILETKIFNGNMSPKKVKSVANIVQAEIKEDDFDDMARHFYERYQDKYKYRRLYVTESRRWDEIDKILKEPFEAITKEEKIFLLIYVVYRYRNNIFHGTKTIREWHIFETEIDICIRFMVLLGNSYDNIVSSRER